MIAIKELSKKTKLPDADYVLEKPESLQGIIDVLTPKFKGKWLILLVEPTIKYVKELITADRIPEWIDVQVYVGPKKVEIICLEFPKLQPVKLTNKEAFDEAVKRTKNLISKQAAKLLYQALGSNSDDLERTLQKLDLECTTGEITYKQVQTELHFTKITYASDVLNSFLLKESQCWQLYNKLIHNIGMDYAYNAMYKYAKSLIEDKQKYLMNEDVKNWHIRKIDAPLICYTYVLFVNSTCSTQLPVILYRILNRNEDAVKSTLED